MNWVLPTLTVLTSTAAIGTAIHVCVTKPQVHKTPDVKSQEQV